MKSAQTKPSGRLPLYAAWREIAATLWPVALAIDHRERSRVVIGVAFGLLVTGALSQTMGGGAVWLVAPLGASAVLVFALPSSPLAQPWAVVGGNSSAALVGIAVANFMPTVAAGTPLTLALASAGAVALMFTLRCLHPPGGAAALLPVLGGITDWRFALFPVLVNSLLLVTAGAVYNRLSGRTYPHSNRPAQPAPPPSAAERYTDADIDRVLARYNQVVDLPRDDLKSLLAGAELESHRRRLGEIRCADIMSGDVVAVEFGTLLQEAWALIRKRRIKALPVVDRSRRVVGIVTLADFLRGADLDIRDGFDERLRRLIRASPASHSDKAEVVGQIMTRQVRVASVERSLAELVPIFSSTGHHHIPVIDADAKLVGILTQSDLVRALAQENAA